MKTIPEQIAVARLPDVVSDHHLKDTQQFILGNLLIIIRVVHFEGEPEFPFPGIQLVFLVLLHRSKVSQNFHELPEVQLVFRTALAEESVDNPLS